MTRYTDLITSEHASQPKFVATVELTTTPLLEGQTLMETMAFAYDLDSAAGVQLDKVGEWVGVSRYVLTPLSGIYFAFDTPGAGFDQGVWIGRFDPTSGKVALDDDVYRLLLRVTIAANVWDGTVEHAATLFPPLFPDNPVIVQDRMDMSITLGIGGPALRPEIAAILTGGLIDIKPFGVRLRIAFSTLPPQPLFGFDVDNEFIGGFNRGAWGAPQPYTQD